MAVNRSSDKLRHAFERLFTQTRHRVQDDTLLEKLRDLLRRTLSANIRIHEARRNEALMVLESVPWIRALTENHQMLNPHVTAFGLAVIGDMAVMDACHRTLTMNAEDVSKFLKDIIGLYRHSHASVRCALFVTLKSLWTSTNRELRDTILSDIGPKTVARFSLGFETSIIEPVIVYRYCRSRSWRPDGQQHLRSPRGETVVRGLPLGSA